MLRCRVATHTVVRARQDAGIPGGTRTVRATAPCLLPDPRSLLRLSVCACGAPGGTVSDTTRAQITSPAFWPISLDCQEQAGLATLLQAGAPIRVQRRSSGDGSGGGSGNSDGSGGDIGDGRAAASVASQAGAGTAGRAATGLHFSSRVAAWFQPARAHRHDAAASSRAGLAPHLAPSTPLAAFAVQAAAHCAAAAGEDAWVALLAAHADARAASAGAEAACPDPDAATLAGVWAAHGARAMPAGMLAAVRGAVRGAAELALGRGDAAQLRRYVRSLQFAAGEVGTLSRWLRAVDAPPRSALAAVREAAVEEAEEASEAAGGLAQAEHDVAPTSAAVLMAALRTRHTVHPEAWLPILRALASAR